MNKVPASPPVSGNVSQDSSATEAATLAWGERIFALMDQAEPPSLFSRKGLYGALLDWAMQDERFKTQLFRFVDVLPTLQSSAEITRHLREYLDPEHVALSPALRAALKASLGASWLFGAGVKAQISALAHQFMLGDEPKQVVRILRDLAAQDIAFTVDILGEKVVSEVEADQYAARYVELIELLARETAKWSQPCKSDLSPRGELPRLNVSIKLSALYSQIHPADPGTAVERMSARLRPILRRAKELGAFINFDMEHYALKDVTLRLFKTVFSEAEFASAPACGLALQAYLRDCETDLQDIVAWARERGRRITIRLVKGAYWDYETVIAQQKGWPVPVFEHKAESDGNFERLALFLLENDDAVDAAFGTHNVRSIAHVLAQAERLGVHRRNFEFQMLYGMADAIKAALLQLDCRVREYCPVGELLPGMAYLVRRLLENTSNEGFLAQKFVKGASREALLRSPAEISATVPLTPALSPEDGGEGERQAAHGEPRLGAVRADAVAVSLSPRETKGEEQGEGGFRNEPPTDFTIAAEREKLREAIRSVRAELGRRHPLVINSKPVTTRDWTASLNPADQREIIGYAAKATVAEAEAALAAAREAERSWARTPIEERAALLERVAELMRRDKARLTAIEILEAGKNWTEADADVAEAIDFCDFYAAVMRELGRPQRTQQVAGETNFQHWWPRGTGVVIAPWNFPLAILCGMTTAAVVTGNTVVMKPSDQTPVIAARFMELLIEAGLPPGVVNLLTGPGSQVGTHLVEHPRVDFIAFTGSKEVGLRIWEAAGRTLPAQVNLKKAICELGGKNALIVDSDADLDEAVTGALISAFGYQGQKCSALARLIVLADNYERFLQRLIAAADSLRVGPAEVPGNVIGPVISRSAQQRILALIEAGKREAKLTWQGRVPDDPNACYVPPTIFTEVPTTSRLFREEIFGPVLAVTKAKDFDEALGLANNSEFALTGGLYSRSPVNIERAKGELVCGNLYINRPITGALVGRQPFGGFKMSGGGTKAGGREYLLQFMLPRVVTENCLRRGFAPLDEA
ncbi:MAG: bifunctional proline dehydrogenase/L-glutamate gamma-semialdehyde dehydrogenase [Verrucomicrobia bacterium]|nr:bifunctional proline dehydrogenase/L-glutamate gamma-semialdehyde dehydrogenase [Verrucomicrobiota bacterium]